MCRFLKLARSPQENSLRVHQQDPEETDISSRWGWRPYKEDPVGADQRTSLGRINEKSEMQTVDGVCFLVKAWKEGWKADLSVFLFARGDAVSCVRKS